MANELKIDENVSDFGGIVSIEMMQQFKAAVEHLQLSIPIGQIAPIYIYDFPEFPLLNLDVWQECDGGIIINDKSPLYNPETPEDLSGTIDELKVNRVPDMRDRYIRMSKALGEDGDFGGYNSYDFGHNHSGSTSVHIWNTNGADANNIGNAHTDARYVHAHSVYSDLTNEINVEPPFFGLKFYMRIL